MDRLMSMAQETALPIWNKSTVTDNGNWQTQIAVYVNT